MSNQSSLWAFCLSFYQHPGVEGLCLKLQDDKGINVNQLLWALWLDQFTPGGDEALWLEGIQRTQRWHRWVVSNVRSMRRGLSKQGLLAPLRRRLLNWELLAERRELKMLEQLTHKRLRLEWQAWQMEDGIYPARRLAELLSTPDCDELMRCFERWRQGSPVMVKK